MRRRVRADGGSHAPPERLRRYDPADWPNPECHPECAFWEAVMEWTEAHFDDDMAPLEIVNGPDTPWHPELI